MLQINDLATQIALTPITDDTKTQLIKAIDQTKKIRNYGPIFAEPVDYVSLSLSDYLDIIKRPMDLQTLKNCLLYNQYNNVQQFLSDSSLIFENCRAYNGNGNDGFYLKAADEAEKQFVAQISKIPILNGINLIIYKTISKNVLQCGSPDGWNGNVQYMQLICKKLSQLEDDEMFDIIQWWEKSTTGKDIQKGEKEYKIKLESSKYEHLRELDRRVTRKFGERKIGK